MFFILLLNNWKNYIHIYVTFFFLSSVFIKKVKWYKYNYVIKAKSLNNMVVIIVTNILFHPIFDILMKNLTYNLIIDKYSCNVFFSPLDMYIKIIYSKDILLLCMIKQYNYCFIRFYY